MYAIAFPVFPQGLFNDMHHRLDINWFLKESRGVHLFGFTPCRAPYSRIPVAHTCEGLPGPLFYTARRLLSDSVLPEE